MRKLGSRYVLHEVLGQGTTGQVWRGSQVHDGAPVAIKVLRPSLADDPRIVERFLREWDLLVELNSPGLVAVRDLVREPDALAIVMDLVDGPDLRSYLRQYGPQPAEEAVRFAIGTLAALDAVHAAGIVHRDVKPENILIDLADPGRPEVRLTDFGTARLVGTPAADAQVTGPVGTPLYMAPELSSGAPPTAAADVYATGIVLYEILAGSPPFDSVDPTEVLRAHREDEPLPIAGVPEAIWDVLARMLAKSPRTRPTSATEAADELDAALTAALRGSGAGVRGAAVPVATAAITAAVGRRELAPAATAWQDMEHTQIAGSPAASNTRVGGWDSDNEHTRLSPTAGLVAAAGARAARGSGKNAASPPEWEADAPTGMAPAVRVPARSGGPAADTNTVMSAIPANRQPGGSHSSSSGGGGGGTRASDRRRRSRIAAGAGLVVALVAGAGGWALASGGAADSSLTAATGVSASTNPTASAASVGALIGGPGRPGVAVGVVPGAPAANGGAADHPTTVRTSAAPGTTPGAVAPTTPAPGAPTSGASPAPSATPDDGTAVVPNTVGSQLNTAINRIQAAGFPEPSRTFSCFNTGAVDQVMQQTPNGGRVARTTQIRLQVQGNDCKEVPNVIGMTEQTAKSTLSGAGFPWVNGACPANYISKVTAYSPATGRHPSGSTTVTLTLKCDAPAPTTAPPANPPKK